MSDSPPAPVRPLFTEARAIAKVRMAEDAWNSREPQRVALARPHAPARCLDQRRGDRRERTPIPVAGAGGWPANHPGLSALGL